MVRVLCKHFHVRCCFTSLLVSGPLLLMLLRCELIELTSATLFMNRIPDNAFDQVVYVCKYENSEQFLKKDL